MKPLDDAKALLASSPYLRSVGRMTRYCTMCDMIGGHRRRKALYWPEWDPRTKTRNFGKQYLCEHHAMEFLAGRGMGVGTLRYPYPGK